MDHVLLIGAEDVASAARTIRGAADDIKHAAYEMSMALDRHATVMQDVVTRLEAALAPKQAMCSKCKKNPEMPAHPCPYRVTCSGDTVTMCNCCDDCQGDCSAEIPA